jgi:predicted dithiol-disulfide oxidoreductase (DUF899 family)
MVSSNGSYFNFDFNVSFILEQLDSGQPNYYFGTYTFSHDEAPGISCFVRDDAGEIFHTYSTFSHGLDMLNGAYHMMDLMPKGRDEAGLAWNMAWLRRNDQYD